MYLHQSQVKPMSTLPASSVDVQPPIEEADLDVASTHRPIAAQIPAGRLSRWYDKIEVFVSRLSVRDNFWHRICSLIWLPYAFFSGIRIKPIASDSLFAVLPF